MKRSVSKLATYLCISVFLSSEIGVQAAELSSSIPSPLTTSFIVGSGDYFQSQSLTLDIQNGGRLNVQDASWETILQQNAAGTSTLNIEQGGVADFSTSAGNGRTLYIGNANNAAIAIINLHGGDFLGGGLSTITFGRNGAHGEFHISSGVAELGALPTFEDGFINFTSGSTGTLQISGADRTWFETMYTAGNLRSNGVNTDAFTNQFHVAGGAIALIGTPLPAQPKPMQFPNPLTLWEKSPGTSWDRQCYPIGNGRLGGVVFGGTEREHILLNEDSLWSGDDASNNVGNYQQLGDLYLNFTGHNNAKNYSRSLNIADAVHSISYEVGNVIYDRTYFASHSAQVMVLEYTASKPGAYSGSIEFTDARTNAVTTTSNGFILSASLADNGLNYEAHVRIVPHGGTLSAQANSLTFSNCDGLTVYVAADTDYLADHTQGWRGVHPSGVVSNQIASASAKEFSTLLEEHIAEYKRLFDRCQLSIGDGPTDWMTTPTSKRLSNYKSGKNDPLFESLIFQYGRYLIISSSRPGYGALPANLQGLWAQGLTPPWRSDYHSNINIQMNYWLTEPTNLSECHQVLIDYFSSLREIRKIRTKDKYGASTRGWTVQTENNIYGGSGWKWNPPGSAWYCQHVWEHYAFTRDLNYLQTQGYPMLKEVCEFWSDRLVTNTLTGKLVSPDTWSPEQGPSGNANANIATYDQELVWDLFNNYVEAADLLGVDQTFRNQIAQQRDQLLLPEVGSWGQLLEWTPEISLDNATNHHRHASQLVGLHPGRRISPLTTPTDAQAANVSLSARGDSGTGWSKAWKISFWARLHNGERAWKILSEQIAKNFYDNLFDFHPPFQIDGNFGYTAGIAEMLLQSHAGEIHLLPALPSNWPKGSVVGLKARGNIEVNMVWDGGNLVWARLLSPIAQNVNIRYDGKTYNKVLQANVPVYFPNSGYNLWIMGKASGADALPFADPDQDQIVNFIEYAFEMNPSIDDAHLAHPMLKKENNRYSLQFRNLQPGVQYQLQYSDDLSQWNTVPSGGKITSETTMPIYLDRSSINAPKQFWRTKISE